MKSERGETKQQQPGLVQRFLRWDWCLLTSCMIGVGLGFALGFALYYHQANDELLMWIGLPGELFMRMLKAAVLPLLISTIITGTSGLQPKENGKVSIVSLSYIILTNVMGALIGVVLAIIIKPGETEDSVSDDKTLDTGNLQTSDLFADLIRNLVPDNVVTACFEKTQTGYKTMTVSVPTADHEGPDNITTASAIRNNSSISSNSSSSNGVHDITASSALTAIANMTDVETLKRYIGKADGTNILGLVIVCTVVGMASAQKGDLAKPFVSFFAATSEVLLLLVQWLVMFTPVGAASLIAKAVGGSTNLEETFRGLGFFVLAETLGNVVLILGMLPLIHFVFMRRNPFSWMLGATRACVTAMVSSSSVVAMPQHLKNVEIRYGVDKRVTSFVVPLVTAINRDGSTMFIALTGVYMAQLQNADSIDNIVLITILSAVGSLAIPATASASVVTILMIMDSLGIQPANIGILLALEWFSDRFRTFANNYSHVLCCLVTWHLCKSSLEAPPPTGTTTAAINNNSSDSYSLTDEAERPNHRSNHNRIHPNGCLSAQHQETAFDSSPGPRPESSSSTCAEEEDKEGEQLSSHPLLDHKGELENNQSQQN